MSVSTTEIGEKKELKELTETTEQGKKTKLPLLKNIPWFAEINCRLQSGFSNDANINTYNSALMSLPNYIFNLIGYSDIPENKAQELLMNGADPNLQDKSLYGTRNLPNAIVNKFENRYMLGKLTLLMQACLNVHVSAATVSLLLKLGADITLKNEDGLTALDLAFLSYEPKLIHQADVEFLDIIDPNNVKYQAKLKPLIDHIVIRYHLNTLSNDEFIDVDFSEFSSILGNESATKNRSEFIRLIQSAYANVCAETVDAEAERIVKDLASTVTYYSDNRIEERATLKQVPDIGSVVSLSEPGSWNRDDTGFTIDAPINTLNRAGRTALFYAIAKTQAKNIQANQFSPEERAVHDLLLLDANPNIQSQDITGTSITPFMIAVNKPSVRSEQTPQSDNRYKENIFGSEISPYTIALMIAKGANFCSKDTLEFKPLDWALAKPLIKSDFIYGYGVPKHIKQGYYLKFDFHFTDIIDPTSSSYKPSIRPLIDHLILEHDLAKRVNLEELLGDYIGGSYRGVLKLIYDYAYLFNVSDLSVKFAQFPDYYARFVDIIDRHYYPQQPTQTFTFRLSNADKLTPEEVAKTETIVNLNPYFPTVKPGNVNTTTMDSAADSKETKEKSELHSFNSSFHSVEKNYNAGSIVNLNSINQRPILVSFKRKLKPKLQSLAQSSQEMKQENEQCKLVEKSQSKEPETFSFVSENTNSFTFEPGDLFGLTSTTASSSLSSSSAATTFPSEPFTFGTEFNSNALLFSASSSTSIEEGTGTSSFVFVDNTPSSTSAANTSSQSTQKRN